LKSELDNIINGCKKHDRESQRLLYELYEAKMRAICRRYCKDTDSAEDLLHDGFMHLFKKISQYKWRGSFEGWMRTIFIGKSVNYVKSKDFKVFNQGNNLDDMDTVIGSNDSNERELFYKSDNVEIEDDLSIDELIALLQKLPVGYRLVFNLYAVEDYTHKEISSMLDITVGTSKSQLNRARKMLQQLLYQYLASKGNKNKQSDSKLLKVVS
jgi:RNA polymerase sigma factor (sigma-70 family)